MTYDEFKDYVADNIKNFLNESYENATVDIKQVVKNNNQELDGLVIRKEGENITPNIYLNGMFDDYEKGKSIDDIMQEIADLRTGADIGLDEMPFSIEDIRDVEKIKDRIECRLVNCEKNAEYLEGKPYTQVEDLAVIYTVNLGKQGPDNLMSTTVTDMLLSDWGISKEELHDIAMENLADSDIQLKSLRDQMIELLYPDGAPDDHSMDFMLPPEDAGPQMYVLTNSDKHYGAKAVLDTKKMDEIAEKLGGDYVILPSSVHEVLILPNANEMDRSALEDMVRTVNATEVKPNEVLSDNVYVYDAQAHEIMRADHYQERQASRQMMQAVDMALGTAVGEEKVAYEAKSDKVERKDNHRERVSVKEQIAEKKAVIAKNAAEKAAPVRNQKREL